MNDDKILLFEEGNVGRIPAKDILRKTAGFEVIDESMHFIFSTSEGKRGYGKQAIPVSELDEAYEALSQAVENGVTRDDYVETTAEVISSSLILNSEDNSVRFKTSPLKGKKPTYFHNESDFQGFVQAFGELLPHIKAKAEKLKQSLAPIKTEQSEGEDQSDETGE